MLTAIDKSTWKKIKLDDAVIRQEENDKEGAKNRFDRFLKVEHMDAESLHIKRWASQQNGEELNPYFYKIFRKGQILFPTRNPHLRRAALASFDGICGEKTLTLEPNHKLVVPEFIPFLFHSEPFYTHTTEAIIGSTNPHVRWRDVANFEFLLPSKEQQVRFAELLWAGDDLVEHDIKLHKALDKLYKRKLSEFSKRQNSRWKQFKLSDLLDLNYGKPLKEIDRLGGNYDVVSSAGVCGQHSEYLVEGPGIVVGRKGSAGNVTWITKNYWPIDTAFWVSIKSEKHRWPLRLFYYLLLAADLPQYSIATAVPGINRDDALSTIVQVPKDENELLLIVKHLDEISSISKLVENKITTSKQLQKSLINQIF